MESGGLPRRRTRKIAPLPPRPMEALCCGMGSDRQAQTQRSARTHHKLEIFLKRPLSENESLLKFVHNLLVRLDG
jgi:hypothetical protein